MTLDLIETLKITIYITKYTPNTKVHFQNSTFFQQINIFRKNDMYFNQHFSLIFYGTFQNLPGLIPPPKKTLGAINPGRLLNPGTWYVVMSNLFSCAESF